MSNKENDLFDDEIEMTLEDDEEEFDESDFDDDVDDDELDMTDIVLDDVDVDSEDDLDEDMLEEDLSIFDIDVDVDDDSEDKEDSDGNETSEDNSDIETADASTSGDDIEATVAINEGVEDKDSDGDKSEKGLVVTNPEAATDSENSVDDQKPKKKKKKALIIIGSILGVIILAAIFFVGTPVGRKMIYSLAAKFVHGNMEFVEGKKNDVGVFVLKLPTPTPIITQAPDVTPGPSGEIPTEVPVEPVEDEIYAKNYLLFGIEQINGGENTDSIMILTINKRDKSLKFTSLLRDTYVDIPGYHPEKLNQTYARGMKQGDTPSERKYYGGMKLIEVIENTYDIKIEGFACVNFNAFEAIVDRLGGVDIELGNSEASYLRRTNYISNPANRTVQAGWNHMNGNQALGYCRVRKVVTLGGANNDYGRTVRQRRVIKAIVDAYTSKGITELLPILADCLSYITTNMTEEQITDIFTDVVENRIVNFEENRLPYDGMFTDSGKTGIYNGYYNVTYALVIDKYRDQIIEKFHSFIYNDPTAVVEEETEDGENEESAATPENGPTVAPAPAA